MGWGVLIAIAVIVLVIRQWQKQGGVNFKSSRSEAQLVKLVGRDVAERLIKNATLRYPGRDRVWCADKALYDLQRDRRW